MDSNDLSTKFRNSTGQRRTRSLFYEYSPETAVYTLDKPREDLPHLKTRYLTLEDPTEYTFAQTYFEDWDHWQMILASPEIRARVDKWRYELQLKIRAQAVKRVLEQATRGGKPSEVLAINKYLAEGRWDEATDVTPKRGRPSKADVQKAAHDALRDAQTASTDFDRIIGSIN